MYGTQGGRVGQRGVNTHRAEVSGPQGGMVGERSVIPTEWERGKHPQS